MAWEIKDEWINLAEGHHKVIFHNPDVLVPLADPSVKGGFRMVPVEHHLHHDFKRPACPHCGHAKVKDGEPIDFHEYKKKMHEELKAHHTELMQYREKHPNVRIGYGPK